LTSEDKWNVVKMCMVRKCSEMEWREGHGKMWVHCLVYIMLILFINCSCNYICILFIVRSVSFIVGVVLCDVLFCGMCVFCVLCLLVVPLPLRKNPFVVKVNI
jgi:hypothetical protein